MSSWETTALRLQGNVTADSTPSSLDKSVKKVSPEEKSHRTTGWKPLSLSTPMLLAMIALTILLAVAVETLAQRSAAQGGLALSPSLDAMPGMIWSWIDLDVKRMQPWFELSKREGATAENSLFLDYQYEFVALVPFKAAKRKHWPVFFGGTAMVIVFWALTPLQSALLGTGIVLDPEFLNTGYAIGWLGQQFPAFTTADYALLPFYPSTSTKLADVRKHTTVSLNITAETTKLWTELNCWPAEIARIGLIGTLRLLSTYLPCSASLSTSSKEFSQQSTQIHLSQTASPSKNWVHEKHFPTTNLTELLLSISWRMAWRRPRLSKIIPSTRWSNNILD
ncbi:hypothetical protein LB503_005263 [Fusarium chuoi]|nr:hypothetical protein LB503_005263 [Fusarium chuoi]